MPDSLLVAECKLLINNNIVEFDNTLLHRYKGKRLSHIRYMAIRKKTGRVMLSMVLRRIYLLDIATC